MTLESILHSAFSKVLSPYMSSESAVSTYRPMTPSHSFVPATVLVATMRGLCLK